MKAKFSEKAIEILKNIIGKEFVSYSAKRIQFNASYNGEVFINANSSFIKLYAEEKEITWFCDDKLHNSENIFGFNCEMSNNQGEEIILVNDVISGIDVITDFVSIPQKNYYIELDMALIIKTQSHNYIFSRAWYFDESIDINIDKNYDDIYSINKVKESWNNAEEWDVKVERKTISL